MDSNRGAGERGEDKKKKKKNYRRSETERVSLSERDVARKKRVKGKHNVAQGCLNGMIYLDVVTDELYKVVYKFTSLHFFLLLCGSLLHFTPGSDFYSLTDFTIHKAHKLSCTFRLDFKVDLIPPVTQTVCE